MTANRQPTASEREFLDFALWMESNDFTGVFTGRKHRKVTAERLVSRGALTRQLLQVCDGDGFALEPERFREGYVLTESGRALALALAAEEPDS